MDEQTVAELDALRARAYGPGADLAQDPDALRRLHELEERALAARAPAAVVEDPETPEPVVAASVVDDPSEPSAEDEGADETPRGEPLRLWWTKRRVTLTWVAALAVAIGVTATVSSAFTYRLQADPREVAVLAIDPGAQWPAFFGDRVGVVFADFYGLRAIAQEGFPSAAGLSDCIQVAEESIFEADAQRGFSGFVNFGGCGGGGFAATASLVVGSDLPDELRERFPDGTALQFVLDGDRVVVLSMPPEPSAAPSQEAAG